MEHVVFFPAAGGSPAFRRLSSLEEAVGLVEHLRNVEGVEQVSVHALTEVPLAFRAYYRVELPPRPGLRAEPVSLVAVAPLAQPDPVVAALPVPEESPVNEHAPAAEYPPVLEEPPVAEYPSAPEDPAGSAAASATPLAAPAAGNPPLEALPEPAPALPAVELPVQGGEPDPVVRRRASLGFFA